MSLKHSTFEAAQNKTEQQAVNLKDICEKKIIESDKRLTDSIDNKIKDLLNLFGTRLQGIQIANDKATSSNQAAFTSKIYTIEKQITQLSQT